MEGERTLECREQRCSNSFDGRGTRCAPESDSASPTRPAGWCACRGTQHVSSCSQMSRHTSGRESGGRRGQRPRNRNHERKSRRAPQRPRAIRKHSLRTLPRSLAVTSTRGQPDEDPRRARRIQPAPQLLSGVCVCATYAHQRVRLTTLSLSGVQDPASAARRARCPYLPKRGSWWSSGCAPQGHVKEKEEEECRPRGAPFLPGGKLCLAWKIGALVGVRACVRACVRE